MTRLKKQKKEKYEKPDLKSIKKSELRFEAELSAQGSNDMVSGTGICYGE